jgi:hypothetical protein
LCFIGVVYRNFATEIAPKEGDYPNWKTILYMPLKSKRDLPEELLSFASKKIAYTPDMGKW